MNEDMFRIGVITSTHGLKGEVKVFPTTDDPARFKEAEKMLYSYKKWRCTSGEKIMQVL